MKKVSYPMLLIYHIVFLRCFSFVFVDFGTNCVTWHFWHTKSGSNFHYRLKSDFTPVSPEGLKIKAIHNFGFVPSLDLRTLNDIIDHRRWNFFATVIHCFFRTWKTSPQQSNQFMFQEMFILTVLTIKELSVQIFPVLRIIIPSLQVQSTSYIK